jgi:putative DNA-invertase from lambdoid prophage Rac
MREYAVCRGWQITTEIKEIGSGALQRPKREELLAAARRRELDAILVWRLDRWGRSLPDIVVTLTLCGSSRSFRMKLMGS